MLAKWQLPQGLAEQSVLVPRGRGGASGRAGRGGGRGRAIVKRERDPAANTCQAATEVRWEWRGDTRRWQLYAADVQGSIEALYQRSRAAGTVPMGSQCYRIDTQAMTQTNCQSGFRRALRRTTTGVPATLATRAGASASAPAIGDDMEQQELARRQVSVAEKRVKMSRATAAEAATRLQEAQAAVAHEERQLFLAKRLLENAKSQNGAGHSGAAAAGAASSGQTHSRMQRLPQPIRPPQQHSKPSFTESESDSSGSESGSESSSSAEAEQRTHTAAAAAVAISAAARGGGVGAASVSVSSVQYGHKCTVKGCTSKRAKLKGFASLKSLVSHVMIMHSGSAHARQYRDEGWEKRRGQRTVVLNRSKRAKYLGL